MSRSHFFYITTSTLGNEYPSSNETSKKNGTVRGDCIACDALFKSLFLFFMLLHLPMQLKLSALHAQFCE